MSGGLKDNLTQVVDPFDVTGYKAGQERKKARKIEQKRQRLQQQRAAIESIRNATIARAEVAAMGETAGIGGSSAAVGALGSIQSQAGANLGFASEQQNLVNQAQARLDRAAKYEFTGDLAKSTLRAFSGGGM